MTQGMSMKKAIKVTESIMVTHTLTEEELSALKLMTYAGWAVIQCRPYPKCPLEKLLPGESEEEEMNNKKELRKRLELTPKERENIRQEWWHNSLPNKYERPDRGFEKLIELSAKAQLNKIMNNKDLAWIDRGKRLPKNPFDEEVARFSRRPIDEEPTLEEHIVVCSSNGCEKGFSLMLKSGYLPVIPLEKID